MYLSGGVLFVTSRILVVDMLTKKLPIHLVTGIVVYRAHKYVDQIHYFYYYALNLNLYRQTVVLAAPVCHVLCTHVKAMLIKHVTFPYIFVCTPKCPKLPVTSMLAQIL